MALLSNPEDMDSSPSTHMVAQQLFAPPVPVDPKPSSGLCRNDVHILYIDRHISKTYFHIKLNNKKRKRQWIWTHTNPSTQKLANKNTTKVNLINYQGDRKTDLTQTSQLEKENVNWGTAPIGRALRRVSGGIFLIIKLDVGGTCPLCVVPWSHGSGLHEKASWGSHRSKSVKAALLHGLLRFQLMFWVPALSLSRWWCGGLNENGPQGSY